MRKLIYASLLVFIVSIYNCTAQRSILNKPFPIINYTTLEGKLITNADLKGKNTVFVVMHIGCPAAMYMLKDMETINNPEVQYIILFENTKKQLLAFNESNDNLHSDVRKYFNLKPISGNILAECDVETINYDIQGNRQYGTECRKLSKKLKTKDTPSIYYINENGITTKIFKGYCAPESPMKDRKEILLVK